MASSSQNTISCLWHNKPFHTYYSYCHMSNSEHPLILGTYCQWWNSESIIILFMHKFNYFSTFLPPVFWLFEGWCVSGTLHLLCDSQTFNLGMLNFHVSVQLLVSYTHLTLLVRMGRSIGLRCVCKECGRPMYRPISFKLYSSRTLHRMLEVFTQLQRAPHLVP